HARAEILFDESLQAVAGERALLELGGRLGWNERLGLIANASSGEHDGCGREQLACANSHRTTLNRLEQPCIKLSKSKPCASPRSVLPTSVTGNIERRISPRPSGPRAA